MAIHGRRQLLVLPVLPVLLARRKAPTASAAC
jgi:hypothetical protein